MTYDSRTDSTVVETCPYSVLEEEYFLLPENRSQVNEAVCGKANRQGLLCSRCKPGYGPAVISYDHRCERCSGGFGWLLYLSIALIPATVFFIVIVVCQVRTTSAPLNFFTFACQMITIVYTQTPNDIVGFYQTRSELVAGIGAMFFAIWNLDFFRLYIPPFCVSENLSSMQVVSMDYIIAFYPLLLTVIMYVCIQQHARGCRLLVCMWRPFGYCLSPLVRRFNWNPLCSTVQVFASFLLLASTKILFVSATLVEMVEVTKLSNVGGMVEHTNLLLYDPHLTVFSQNHLPYAALAFIASTIFVILPCLLLILYPTRLFQKFLNCCGIRWHALQAFADAFNGCYKNGTNGTRDYRSFAGFHLFLRVVWMTTALHDGMFFIPQLLLITSLLFFALACPYRNRLFNVLESFALAYMACKLCITNYQEIIGAIGAVGLLVYFAIFVSCKIVLKLNCRCSEKLKALGDRLAGATAPEREADDVQENLPWPHRLEKPDEYGPRRSPSLDMTEDEPLNSGNTTSTYGSLQ